MRLPAGSIVGALYHKL